jgi:poly(3-hydroxybutyrate) depolymerase
VKAGLRTSLALAAVAVIVLIIGAAARQSAPAAPQAPGKPAAEHLLAAGARELAIREGLAVGLVGAYGRSAVPSDLLAFQLATGTFVEPREGTPLNPDDKARPQAWTRVEAGADGWIQSRALNGGSLYVVVNSERARTMVLDASGYYVVRVNGEPRGGEKYGMDWVRNPVRLNKGRNVLLFQGERGRIRARLFDPPAPVFFVDSDATLPDIVVGESRAVWAGLRAVNTTEETIDSFEISYSVGERRSSVVVRATVPPLSARKIPVLIEAPPSLTEGAVPLALTGRARSGSRVNELPAFNIPLKAVRPTTHYVRTFLSDIDGSVQYYGVAPYIGPAGGSRPALVVSLHGAGVEGAGQARAYKPKDWTVIVAPTNRRPYGFDWEDWGRLDAQEVQADAAKAFDTDPSRTYLTGHSMGGHGTWSIGAIAPDAWAAIAPSAGWRSFSTYGGGPAYKDPTPTEAMLVRANHPGETTELARNFLHYGVYILHGDQDDNVPVAQARFMRELLGKFHPDFGYYERPGAGHWWGDECVDWPPLFAFLRQHVRPADADTAHVEFVTANPGIASSSRWVSVVAQEHPLEYSRVTIDRDIKTGAFKGTTANVTRLALTPPGAPAASATVRVDLDGTRLDAAPSADGRIHLSREPSGWRSAEPWDPRQKNPMRSGGFKDAFRHRVVLVYGTGGTPDERARTFQKARFDAETFWYRGNGSVDVVSDKVFDPAQDRDRNVVLYGNADTNALWSRLLGGSPVEVRSTRIKVGERDFQGADLGIYFVRPREGSAVASVGAVAWTGAAGWAAVLPVQYFVSGAGFPDLMLVSADMLKSGTAGVRAIGWFGNDWSVERGEFVWAAGVPVQR